MTEFLRLAVRCPSCNRLPSIRTTASERERKLTVPPDELVETYECKCGEVYPINAEAYQRANVA